jgi:cysteinyl-tRNA synthetase
MGTHFGACNIRGLAVAGCLALGALTAAAACAQSGAGRLSGLTNWGYQLQNIDPTAVAASAFDLVVIDPTRDGETPFLAAEILQMQGSANGGRRIVLAYFSIGEAEDYRPYWRPRWNINPPPWLAAENPNWRGNFKVRYWHPEWQAIVFAALDVIVAAGFDGVFLDIVDAYEFFEATHQTAAADMVAFVAAIAARGRAAAPGFVVMPQNAEGLLAYPAYRSMIDGFAKEDLFYGVDGDGRTNAPDEVAWSTALLDTLIAEGGTVLVVEYLDDPDKVASAEARAAQRGYLFLAAERDLDRLPAFSPR